jgi:hypothetical protein
VDAGAYVANMGSGIHYPLFHMIVIKSVVYPGVKPEEDLWVYYLTDVWCQSKNQCVKFMQQVNVS